VDFDVDVMWCKFREREREMERNDEWGGIV
jgi:hypothetical protein